MESRIQQVIDNHNSGCNCSQSIFVTYYDLFQGIQNGDVAKRLSLAFGGGLARTQGVCGAVCGSAMLLGLKYSPGSKAAAEEIWEFHELVRSFMKDFEEENGSVYCRDIVRSDITTPEAYLNAHGNMEQYCPKAIVSAAKLLEEKYKIMEKSR